MQGAAVMTATTSAIVDAPPAASGGPSKGACEKVSPRVRTSGPGRPPLIDTPQVPIPPQWSSAWRRFERAYYSQSDATIRNRRIAVAVLARWLSLPDNGAIMDPAEVTRQHLREYLSAQEAVRQDAGSSPSTPTCMSSGDGSRASTRAATSAPTPEPTGSTPARPARCTGCAVPARAGTRPGWYRC
jgi:hypothetical protein